MSFLNHKYKKMDDNVIKVYRHRRLDTNEIFYIGIGSSVNRAYSKRSRNSLWHNIVNKYGYSVEIIAEVDTWELACELEQFLIQEYGRRDLGLGTLVNMTDGGDGSLNMESPRKGVILSDETKRKISEAKKGKPSRLKGKTLSEEVKRKMSEAQKDRLAPNRKKVICIITGFIWDSIKECANDNNINYHTLKYRLNDSKKNNTNFIIYE